MRSIYTATPFAAALMSETAPRPSTRSSSTGVGDIEYVKITNSRDASASSINDVMRRAMAIEA